MNYTLDLIESRHSVRVYDGQKLTEAECNALRADISEINSYLHGTRFQLFTDNDAPFKGLFGGYGSFKNVRNYVAAVMDTGVPFYAEIAGYAAEQIVLHATALGLGSCIVGGTYSSSAIPAQLRAGEKIIFIIALGHAGQQSAPLLGRLSHIVMHAKKVDWEQFYDLKRSAVSLAKAVQLYPKLEDALRAVACAPSALNKRPVRIWLDAMRDIRAAVPDYAAKYSPVDLGVAKFNFRAVFDGEWEFGNCAKFIPA